VLSQTRDDIGWTVNDTLGE